MYRFDVKKVNDFSSNTLDVMCDQLGRYYALGQAVLITSLNDLISQIEQSGVTAVETVTLQAVIQNWVNEYPVLQDTLNELFLDNTDLDFTGDMLVGGNDDAHKGKGAKVIEFKSFSEKSKRRTSRERKDNQ